MVIQRYVQSDERNSVINPINVRQLCDRSFGNVTFVGAHDSYAVSSINREPGSGFLASIAWNDLYPKLPQTRTKMVYFRLMHVYSLSHS